MQRRTYLAVFAASLAGCSSSGSEDPEYEEDGTEAATDTAAAAEGDETATESGQATEADTETETSTARAEVVSAEFVEKETDLGTEKAVTGEVENTGDSRLSYVETTATFLNEDGDVLETSIANVVDLEPGETWEVWTTFPGDGADAADGTLDVADASQWSTSNRPENVELGDHELVRPEGEFSDPYVDGEATNVGDESVDYVEARAKFYAENGNVLYSTMTNVTDLAADQTWQFELEFLSTNSDWAGRVDDYAVALST